MLAPHRSASCEDRAPSASYTCLLTHVAEAGDPCPLWHSHQCNKSGIVLVQSDATRYVSGRLPVRCGKDLCVAIARDARCYLSLER